MVATMAHEFKRDNFTETEPHTHQQEFHRSGLPPALQPLTSQRRWVCWCWKWQEKKEGKPGEGKWTKPPIQAGAGYPAYARTDDPTTWSTYEAAVARVRDGEADGIGLCLLGANIGVADLDNCYVVETGAIAPWAQAIIDRAPKGTYCEISVSGTGLHLLGEATGKRLIRKYPAAEAAADDDVAGSFELFRNASRYITISGLVIHSASGKLTDIDPLLNELHTEGEERRTQPQQRKSAKQASARLLRKGKWTRGGMTIDLFNLIAEGVDEPSRSAQFFHAIAWLKRLDWTVEGITWLLGKHPNGIATKYTGRLRAEVERVYNKVEPDGDNLGDFFAFAPQHTFIELVSRKPWPAISIDNRLPMQALVDEDGQLVRAAPVIGKNGKPKGDPDGDPVLLKPSVWLDQNRSINGITWAPGMPLVVFDKVIVESIGWIDAPGKATFNTYRAPMPGKGDPRKAGPWLKLVRKVYGRHARRIVQWFAYRVQRPDVKINHGLVFGGVPGIGKDTIIEGVREAIGGWNIRDASPLDMFEKYNAYAKAVLLRINESRDTGEQSQHALYNKMKTYLAAPPPTLTVNEKYIAHDDIPNVCGGIITTNYKETGLFLPPDDRRNYML